ncbi:reverse transcriptase domain-containing protein [Tanacetum coccineum]
MTLELANRSVTYPMGIAEDVIVKVDKFNFLADFVIVDFEADPRVPIILGRPFLRTAKALVDIYKEKLALRIGNKELVFRAKMFSKNSPSRERHSGHSINIIDSPCEEISNHDKQSSGSTTSHYDLSFPDYEAFCFDINHQEEKSSGSTTSRSDHSLPDYKAFCFDIDHHEEKSSVSTTSHSDPSLFEYESFYFDLLIDTLPPADRSDYHHEEFTDELAHIISPPECDHFFFDIKVDPGELTRLLIEISSSKMSTSLKIHKDGDGDALFQLKTNSLPHAHAQTTKTCYKYQDSRIIKAQELKTKTSAQTLIIKIFLQRYQVYQGRLLASFQDAAKYEHVGQDTISQGGKDDQDERLKI